MLRSATLLLGLAMAAPALAQAPSQTLTVALADDADLLDPTIARSYVSRIIFEGLCDKLFDINESLEIVPKLALSYEYQSPTVLVLKLRPGVVFHDGTKLDADAVAYTLKRHLTMSGSTRRAEISALDHTEVLDPLTVRLVLKEPSAPFMSQLTDRAGMIVSPKAAEAAGADFGLKPVCAGPFRFVERVAQDRVVVERFPEYWDADSIHFARVVYRTIVNGSVRFNNLQAGTVDFAERILPTDVAAIKADPRLAVQVYNGLGYGSVTFNVGNGAAARTPFGQSALVRKAFERAIDRQALVDVVFNGMFPPVAQGMTPRNPMYNPAVAPLPRDIPAAKALLAQAGVTPPVAVTLTMLNSPDQVQVGEVMQAMAAEAGFDVKVQAAEFASALMAQTRGDFQATAIGWSGRVDPDGNIYNPLYGGAPLNASGYANKALDAVLDQARAELDPTRRRALYAKATEIIWTDMPVMYLYNTAMIMGMSRRIAGFRPVPDGLLRLRGLMMVR